MTGVKGRSGRRKGVPMVNLVVRVEPSLRDAIRAAAVRAGVEEPEWVRMALRKEVVK